MTSPDPNHDRSVWSDVDAGWGLTVELVTATFLWGGIGWLVDRWLGTEPWFLVAGFILGFGLGMYLVILRSNEQNAKDEARRSAQRTAARQPAVPPPTDDG